LGEEHRAGGECDGGDVTESCDGDAKDVGSS
jgi:hypothetical protein